MSEKRFIYGRAFAINSDDSWPCITDTEKDKDYLRMSDIANVLNEQQATIKSKDKQLERLYNYFQDYLKDEMSGNAFSEMWDNVKEDERWNDE